MCEAQHANGRKPHQRDRPEKLADARRAMLLHHEQPEQHHQRQRTTTARLKVGDTTSRPSTADSTEMAGVMTPSP
jgi:cell division protein FtsN